MKVYGLDVYRASAPLDEPAIKHRDTFNKANAQAVQKAQQALEQEQVAQQSQQAQTKAPAQVNNTQAPASPKEVAPPKEQRTERGYNLAFMSIHEAKEVAEGLRTSGEKDLSDYLFSSLSLLTSRYEQFMPTENGIPSQTQPFNLLGFLQETGQDMTEYQDTAIQDFLERLKSLHTGIDEMV